MAVFQNFSEQCVEQIGLRCTALGKDPGSHAATARPATSLLYQVVPLYHQVIPTSLVAPLCQGPLTWTHSIRAVQASNFSAGRVKEGREIGVISLRSPNLCASVDSPFYARQIAMVNGDPLGLPWDWPLCDRNPTDWKDCLHGY